MVNPFRDEVELKQVFAYESGDDTVRELTLDVSAVNPFTARQKARRFTRTRHPTAKNILSPDVEGSEGERQTTFREIFPETFHTKTYETKVTVVD